MAKSDEQKAALAESKAKAKARRLAFASGVTCGREIELPAQPLSGVGRLPAWGVWLASDDQLAVLVPAGENWRTVDKALAYGLAHAKGRRLTLVLPDGFEAATCVRAAFLNHPVNVYAHGDSGHHKQVELTQEQAMALVTEKGGLRLATHSLGPKQELVARLIGWADGHASLTPAHTAQYMSWHAYGMQVLKMRRAPEEVVITGGIHYSGDKKPTPIHVTEPLERDLQSSIQEAVEAGIVAARVREAGPYKEHLLQENLIRQRDHIGWHPDDILIREFPAIRPSGGSGFIDFLRLEADGTLHIIETKIGHDEFVVLQGLDYWIWARSNWDLLAKYFQTEHDREIRDVVVDYVLGDESDSGTGESLLSPYAASHIKHLPETMPRTFFSAHPLDSGQVRLGPLSEPQLNVKAHGPKPA